MSDAGIKGGLIGFGIGLIATVLMSETSNKSTYHNKLLFDKSGKVYILDDDAPGYGYKVLEVNMDSLSPFIDSLQVTVNKIKDGT